MKDRRIHSRLHVLRRAQAVFGLNRSSIGCVVLDLSVGGAHLQVDDWMSLPQTFELRIKGGAARRCEIRHRDLDRAGVRFIDEAA